MISPNGELALNGQVLEIGPQTDAEARRAGSRVNKLANELGVITRQGMPGLWVFAGLAPALNKGVSGQYIPLEEGDMLVPARFDGRKGKMLIKANKRNTIFI